MAGAGLLRSMRSRRSWRCTRTGSRCCHLASSHPGFDPRRQNPYQVWTPAPRPPPAFIAGLSAGHDLRGGLGCTKKSALGRLRRLDWGAEFFGGFKTKDLVRELRVPETAIERWVRLGWLRRKRGTASRKSLFVGCASTTLKRYRSRRSLLKHGTGWCCRSDTGVVPSSVKQAGKALKA